MHCVDSGWITMEIGTRIIDSAGRIRRRFGRVLLRTVVGTVVVQVNLF